MLSAEGISNYLNLEIQNKDWLIKSIWKETKKKCIKQ